MKTKIILALILLFLASHGIACETYDLLQRYIDSGLTGPPIVLTRPQNQHQWVSPDGIFLIHYDTEGENAVYEADVDVSPVNGIPDYVDRVASYFHDAHIVYISDMGFDLPPNDYPQGGDARYDIYINDVPGLTSPEAPSNQYPGRPAYTSYIQIGYDLRTQHYPNSPYPYMRATIAHEYFHAVQFAYRVFSHELTPWWFESCANWAEEKVFDDLNDVYYYLEDYLQFTHKSLYQAGGNFDYGAWLFPNYLDERFGPSLILDAWQTFASFDFAVAAVDVSLSGQGTSFNSEFCLHSVWNYFTGANYLPGFYSEGQYFPVSVWESHVHLIYPVDWTLPAVDLENVASSYIVFRRPDISRGDLIIDYSITEPRNHAICIAVVRPGQDVEIRIEEINLASNPSFIVSDFASAEKVILIPVWQFEGVPMEGFTSYLYRARIDSSTSSAGDNSELPVAYELITAYPNPFNGAVKIAFRSPHAEEFQLKIFNVNGDQIFNQFGNSVIGENYITWSPADNIASSFLLYSLEFPGKKLDGRIIYLK